jgi:hypothetical protein
MTRGRRAFHIHVDVLVRLAEREHALVQLALDGAEPSLDSLAVRA